MANTIKPKRSATAAKVPTTSDLASGELGVNMTDQKVYIHNGSAVVQVGAGTISALGETAISSPSSGQPLVYNGTNWANASTLGAANGGTGQGAYTDGQLLIGNTSTGGLSKATLTAGSNVTITNGNGTISIAASSGSGTVTSVAALTLGTTGTDLSSTVANGTTTPVITLNVPTASAANRGALSSTDWSTFNGKQASITATGILKGAGSGSVSAATAGTDYAAPGSTTTYTVVQNFAASGITLKGSSTGTTTFASANSSATNYTLTFPAITDTAVTLTASQTLTNKTLTSPTLTTPDLGTPSAGALTNCTADGTNGVGYINIPQVSKSAAYTLVLGDAGKHILHPSADNSARTFTIPANGSVAYPIGTALTFINQNGAGTVTIAITTDTMRLAGAGTTGSRTLAANGVATAIKVTSTEWIISGTNLT